MGTTLRTGVLAAVLLAGCGGSSDGGGGGGGGGGQTGSCTPRTSATMSVGAAGFTPRAACVQPGGTFTLSNTDTAEHVIQAGAPCTELNFGAILAGESRTATLPTVATCTFTDAAHSTEATFQGVLAVSNAPAPGPGY